MNPIFDTDTLAAQLAIIDLTVRSYFARLSDRLEILCRAEVIQATYLNGPRNNVGMLNITCGTRKNPDATSYSFFLIANKNGGFDLVSTPKTFENFYIAPHNLDQIDCWGAPPTPLKAAKTALFSRLTPAKGFHLDLVRNTKPATFTSIVVDMVHEAVTETIGGLGPSVTKANRRRDDLQRLWQHAGLMPPGAN